MKNRVSGLLAALAVSAIGVPAVSADSAGFGDSWRYGVMTDTQGAGAYPDVSTRLMAPVVDRFVNEHQIDMMLSVGDLSDKGSRPEFDLWNQTAQPLYDAGIPVYATRGNHDVKTETTFSAVDPLFGPVDVRNTDIRDDEFQMPSNPSIVQGPGQSYMFSHE
ncbi:MAG: metallophosphoesterase family protein, partial [Phycisphaeraceae bacterium]